MESYHPDQSLFPNSMSINSGHNFQSMMFEHQPYHKNKLTPVMSDVQFPADNVSQGGRQDQDICLSGGGRLQLPQDLEEMVNSLLPNDYDFPLTDCQTGSSSMMDLEIGAASLWLDDDQEILNMDISHNGSNNGGLQPTASGPSLPNTRHRRPKTKRSQRSSVAHLQPPIAHYPTSDTHLQPYPPLEELGVANESYSHSYPPLEELGVANDSHSQQYLHPEDLGVVNDARLQLSPPLEELGAISDAGSSTSSDAAARPRRRRPRVSYSTLTEEEKYQRNRELNNEASKLYRERHRNQLSQMEDEERTLREKNATLRAKAEGLEKLRDSVKQFSHNFLRQHLRPT